MTSNKTKEYEVELEEILLNCNKQGFTSTFDLLRAYQIIALHNMDLELSEIMEKL
jgi:hypothetical protein